MSEFHLLLMCELHQFEESQSYLNKYFNQIGRKFTFNPSRDIKEYRSSKTKGHGGEGIAWQSHLKVSPVSASIIGQICDITQSHMCLSACMLRLVNMSVLIVSMYMYDGEGLSNRNLTCLAQLYALVCIFKLPFICCGDFNMPPRILAESGYLGLLHADILCTNLTATLKNTDNPDSHIDYVVHSIEVRSIIILSYCRCSRESPYSFSSVYFSKAETNGFQSFGYTKVFAL